MRLPSKRKSILMAVALLLVGVGAVLGWHAFRVGGPWGAEPVLRKIEVYHYCGPQSYVSLDVRRSRFRMMSGSLADRLGMGLLEFPITKGETQRIERLVSSCPDLRSFSPRSRWFGECMRMDQGVMMVFVWSDSTRAYAIPPEDMRTNVPQFAREIYIRLDEIDGAMYSARSAYAKLNDWPLPTKPPLPEDDPRLAEFDRSRDRHLRMSLPKNRVGW